MTDTSLTLTFSSNPVSYGDSCIVTASLYYAESGVSSTSYVYSFSGLAAGQTETLQATPGSFTMLVVNGLVQPPSSFTVSGESLIIPAGLAWDGAPCYFFYST